MIYKQSFSDLILKVVKKVSSHPFLGGSTMTTPGLIPCDFHVKITSSAFPHSKVVFLSWF